MTIAALLSKAVLHLTSSGSDEPEANAQWLLACVLNVSRTWVLAHPEYELSEKEKNIFARYLKRKAAGEPLSHIVGYQPFCGMDILVSPDVLTPRPETEELVELVSALFDRQTPLTFLDMCTGSGCIALALAAKFPKAKILAADISAKALEVAQQNVKKFRRQEQVQLLQSNVWENVQGMFDLIVSNPPYIPTEIVNTLTREVRCEPRLALDGGVDGLDIVREICNAADSYLNPGGVLALELCKGQAAAVARGLEEIGWRASVKKDIVGIERFVLAQKI